MRRMALFLLVCSLTLIAAESTRQDLGAPVLLQEGEETEAQPEEIELPPPEGAEESEYTDEPGNFKLTLPAGWEVRDGAPDEASNSARLMLQRMVDGSSDPIAMLQVLRIPVYRFRVVRTEELLSKTVSELLDQWEKETKPFEMFFGEGSTGQYTPELDASYVLEGLDESSAFEYSGIKPEEAAKVREMEDRVRRGDKEAKVPEYDPIVIRGRIGVLSPHFWVLRTWPLYRPLSVNTHLNAEMDAILDSFALLDDSAKAVPLCHYRHSQQGASLAHVTDDTLSKAEKGAGVTKHVLPYTFAGKRKTYAIEIKFQLPAGWEMLEKKQLPTGNHSTVVFAQDKDNNWIKMDLWHLCLREGSARDTLDQQALTWKNNWEGSATRAKVPRSRQKFTYAGIKGVGYKKLEGKKGGQPATFTCVVGNDSGWRHYLTVETRGSTAAFKKARKKFEKSIKINDK